MSKEKLMKLVNIAFKQKALSAKRLESPYRKFPIISSAEWEESREILLEILDNTYEEWEER